MSDIISEPILFVVATPIGNLKDISERAASTLQNVDLIASEDTRRTKAMLKELGIRYKEIISYFDAVEERKAKQIVDRMAHDKISVALVSDAGTPCISDPGYRLVLEARNQGIKVVPIPGASALVSLVSVSGLPNHRFVFIGFLPTKSSALRSEIESWGTYGSSVVFYEAANRLLVSLEAIAKQYPKSQICIGRELTKMYEETILMSTLESIEWCKNHAFMKGEIVCMVEPRDDSENIDYDGLKQKIADLLAEGMSTKDILELVKLDSLSKSETYRLIISLKGKLHDD